MMDGEIFNKLVVKVSTTEGKITEEIAQIIRKLEYHNKKELRNWLKNQIERLQMWMN